MCSNQEMNNSVGIKIQPKIKHHGLKHTITPTIHVEMGNILKLVVIQIQIYDLNFNIWGKYKVIFALSKTKIGKNIIFVQEKKLIIA